MSQSSFWADKPLGYIQSGAGAIDAAVTIASLFPGGVIPSGTQLLIIQPQAQAIRWRDDATAPTASVGYPLAVGAELRYTGAMAALRVIGQAASGVLNIVAYG
jgi:hypothetical protein